MECYQPVGSFKIRGIGLLCERAAAEGKRRFVSSSGGNAGFAATYAARELGLTATVVVPSTTPDATRDLLSLYGANVIVQGDVWDVADLRARELASAPDAAYVPPFDHPTLWEGHSSMVDEMAQAGRKPDVVIVSVGGGGLMCGVLEGLHRNGWKERQAHRGRDARRRVAESLDGGRSARHLACDHIDSKKSRRATSGCPNAGMDNPPRRGVRGRFGRVRDPGVSAVCANSPCSGRARLRRLAGRRSRESSKPRSGAAHRRDRVRRHQRGDDRQSAGEVIVRRFEMFTGDACASSPRPETPSSATRGVVE